MCSFLVVVLHTLFARIRADDLEVNRIGNTPRSESRSWSVEELVDRRFFQTASFSHTDLESTTFGKTGGALVRQKTSLLHGDSQLITPAAFRHTQSTGARHFSVPMLAKPDLDYAPANIHSCPHTSYALYTQMKRQLRLAPLRAGKGDDASTATIEAPASTVESASTATAAAPAKTAPAQTPEPKPKKEIDQCSRTELQVMYVDALYSYYQKGVKLMKDDEFDKIKQLLAAKGSTFPRLRRDDIMFVEATVAYDRGEPVLSDEDYNKLKKKIKDKGKNEEITELLLFMKDQGRLKADQFRFLLSQGEMDLKVMYVDALVSYYMTGKKILSDKQFDLIKIELTSQGSSFPQLRRDDVMFVEATVAYARGKPIMSDTEYESLKKRVRAKGKNQEITELIMFLKGRDKMNPEEFQNLLKQMGPSQLETMYVDALFNYYEKGEQTLTDDQFDQLREELNWQGSKIPTLKRYEIKFAAAALAYARGTPLLSDEEYEKLRAEVKAKGKRKEVTEFLLYTKGAQGLSQEQFKKFAKEMGQTDMKVAPTADGTCTLTGSPPQLQNDVLDVIAMYTTLGIVPTTICTGAYFLLAAFLGGPNPVGTTIAGLSSVAVTRQLVRYLGLTSPQLLEGVCPTCNSNLRTFASDVTGKQLPIKCQSCLTKLNFNAEKLLIDQVNAAKYDETEITGSKRDWNVFMNDVALAASEAVIGISDGSGLGPMKAVKKPKAANKEELIKEGLKEGIFAWAILIGYSLFGEMFVGRVRGKGIAIHSGVINDFCNQFAIPAGLRQKYIQTAKKNGHDLGFLVQGEKQFGDGFFGKEAMKWWKSTGW